MIGIMLEILELLQDDKIEEAINKLETEKQEYEAWLEKEAKKSSQSGSNMHEINFLELTNAFD